MNACISMQCEEIGHFLSPYLVFVFSSPQWKGKSVVDFWEKVSECRKGAQLNLTFLTIVELIRSQIIQNRWACLWHESFMIWTITTFIAKLSGFGQKDTYIINFDKISILFGQTYLGIWEEHLFIVAGYLLASLCNYTFSCPDLKEKKIICKINHKLYLPPVYYLYSLRN